jgi:hypothetical protein
MNNGGRVSATARGGVGLLRVVLSAFVVAASGFAAVVSQGCAVGPDAPGGVLNAPDPVTDLEARVKAEPHKLELWRELTGMYLRERDGKSARAAAAACVRRNPSEPNAWLLSANVSRTLLDLIAAHSALREAYKLGGDEKAVAASREALASFCEETWLWAEAVKLREAGWEAAKDEAKQARAANEREVHENLPNDGSFEWTLSANAAVEDSLVQLLAALEAAGESQRAAMLDHDGWIVSALCWTRRVLVSVRSGNADVIALKTLAVLPDPKFDAHVKTSLKVKPPDLSAYVHTALRLVPLVSGTEQYDTLATFLDCALKMTETSATRFAAYLAYWEIGWMRERRRAIPGVPASNPDLAAKLDQIDSGHPDWVLRQALASVLAGDGPAAAADAAKMMERLGLPEAMRPPLPQSAGEFRDLLIVLDAEAIGAAWQMLEAVGRLQKGHPGSGFLAVAEVRAEFALMHFERVLELTAAIAPRPASPRGTPVVLNVAQPELRAALLELRWKALIRDGKAKQMLEELRAEGEAKEPAPMPARTAAWLKAVAEMHVAEELR